MVEEQQVKQNIKYIYIHEFKEMVLELRVLKVCM